MADSKLASLTDAGVAAATDLFYIVRDPSGTPLNRKLTAANLGTFLARSGFPYMLAQSAVAVPRTGSTDEVALATITIPAGTIGANGSVRITTLWSHTNSANTKTWRIRLGGISGTQFASIARTSTAADHDIRIIRNRNSASSQVAFVAAQGIGVGSSTGGMATGSVDTAVDQDLVISAQLASAGETITLEGYTVEILYKA